MTPKQELFVKEYLVDLNATQAAIRAGYSEKTAYAIGEENLRKPVIAESIKKAMDERAKRVDLNADYVLKTIIETVERCKQNIEPIYEGRGEDRRFTGEFQFDSGAVLKGCELLGKHLKLFTDKTEVTGKNGAPIEHNVTSKIDMSKLNEDQLRAISTIKIDG